MATTTRSSVRTNGTKVNDELALRPPPGRARLPEMAVGVLVVVGFALAAVLWHLNAIQRDPVLALAVDVGRGETIEVGDLRVAHVASDDRVALLAPERSGEVLGRAAAADLPAGTLMAPGLVTALPAIDAEQGVVALALERGQVPSTLLGPGDIVNVVSADAVNGEGGIRSAVAERAEVVEVEQPGEEDRWYVSLRMQEPTANEVAAAAERGPLRLVMVAP